MADAAVDQSVEVAQAPAGAGAGADAAAAAATEEELSPEDLLQAKLVQRLQAEFVSAVDLSDGCGSKFQCVIISTMFEGKPLLVRPCRGVPSCRSAARTRR